MHAARRVHRGRPLRLDRHDGAAEDDAGRTPGDPRPSLQELYGSHDGYVQAIATAARHLAAESFTLQEDIKRFSAEAEARNVLK